MDEAKLKIISDNPIGSRLDAFRDGFASICGSRGLVASLDAFDQLEQRDIVFDLLTALQGLRALRLLPSPRGNKFLLDEILSLSSAQRSSPFSLGPARPLLRAVLHHSGDDAAFWAQVDKAFLEATPPPPLSSLFVANLPASAATTTTATPSVPETPWTRNTVSILNSSEFRREVDPILKRELGNPRVGIRGFREAFFACVPGLETAAAAVFNQCCEGDEPVFGPDGWDGWPPEAREGDVLAWFGNIITKLDELAAHHRPASLETTHRRKLLAQPRTPLVGSTGRRSMDIGFVNDDFVFRPELGRAGRYRWSHVLVPGELKSNPIADAPAVAWIDLATYAREVLSAQDTRRFVLAFTLCGSNLRLWEYDRMGGIASEKFNINEPKGSLEFVASILGFLWISEEGLGFDPTIKTSKDTRKRFIEIERKGKPERLIINEVITRPRCIASRATTCWKAHREGDPLKAPLVIKDSWQYPEREEEGLLVKEATEKGVNNIARYYYHETVHVGGAEDEVQNCIRKGLDMTPATVDIADATTATATADTAAQTDAIATTATSNNSSNSNSNSIGHSNGGGGDETSGGAGTKRGQSEANLAAAATERPAKRPRSGSANPSDASRPLTNRVHRRVVLQDYGRPLYTASSPAALIAALESCVRGHESLRQHGFLHRDISINNLVIDEDGPPGRKGFLIDLDLAIREQQTKGSGTKGKTGTRAFMAIGVLFDEPHSFMHDLESFFWVLFWTCIHFDGPNQSVKTEFDEWNYAKDELLAGLKLINILSSERFCKRAEAFFTPFYSPLIPMMDKLRAAVFPDGKPWVQEDEGLYASMREILLKSMSE
ncbi:hypothetical protein HDV63DRAFT_233201 [Trichoderma sp. SZMC 28014]